MKTFFIALIAILILVFLALLGEAYFRGADLTDPVSYIPMEIRQRLDISQGTR